MKEALIRMVNDADHAVRMHMAKVVTSLHYAAVTGGDRELASLGEQRKVFLQVSNMLKKAHLISVS